MNNQTIPSTRADIIHLPPSPADRILPEGIKFHPTEDLAAYVNITSGNDEEDGSVVLLSNFDASGHPQTFEVCPVPFRPSFLAFGEGHDILLAGEKDLWQFSRKTKIATMIMSFANIPGRWMFNDGLVLNNSGEFATHILISGKSTESPKTNNAPSIVVNVSTKEFSLLPGMLPMIGNGKVLIPGDLPGQDTLLDIDTPTGQVRGFNFNRSAANSFQAQQFSVVFDLAGTKWKGAGLDGSTGPFYLAGKNYMIAALWNEEATDGSAIVIDVGSGQVVHEFICAGSGQVTCPAVFKDRVYLTTATEGMDGDGFAANPNGGSLFMAELPGFLKGCDTPKNQLLKMAGW